VCTASDSTRCRVLRSAVTVGPYPPAGRSATGHGQAPARALQGHRPSRIASFCAWRPRGVMGCSDGTAGRTLFCIGLGERCGRRSRAPSPVLARRCRWTRRLDRDANADGVRHARRLSRCSAACTQQRPGPAP
jgi:hypothetical protein